MVKFVIHCISKTTKANMHNVCAGVWSACMHSHSVGWPCPSWHDLPRVTSTWCGHTGMCGTQKPLGHQRCPSTGTVCNVSRLRQTSQREAYEDRTQTG